MCVCVCVQLLDPVERPPGRGAEDEEEEEEGGDSSAMELLLLFQRLLIAIIYSTKDKGT